MRATKGCGRHDPRIKKLTGRFRRRPIPKGRRLVDKRSKFPLLTFARLAVAPPSLAAAYYLVSPVRARMTPARRCGYNPTTSWPERICYLYPILAAAHRKLSPDFTGDAQDLAVDSDSLTRA